MFGCRVSSPTNRHGANEHEIEIMEGALIEGAATVKEEEKDDSDYERVCVQGSTLFDAHRCDDHFFMCTTTTTVTASDTTSDDDDHDDDAGNRRIEEVSPDPPKTPREISGLKSEWKDREEGSQKKLQCNYSVETPIIARVCQDTTEDFSSLHSKLLEEAAASSSSTQGTNQGTTGETKKFRLTNQDEFNPKPQTNNQPFYKGQHVFVIIGKTEYPAVVVSLIIGDDDGPQTARVRWSTMGTLDVVEVSQLRPMFDETNGDLHLASYSVRNRKPTNRFAPPLLQENPKKKKIKQGCQETKESRIIMPNGQLKTQPCTEGTRTANKLKSSGDCPPDGYSPPDWSSTPNNDAQQSSTSITPCTMTARSRKKAEMDADYIIENLDRLPILRSGVAPGPGWNAQPITEANGLKRVHWISPTGKRFICLRLAYRFERIVRQLNGDEAKAWVMYKRGRLARKSSSKTAMPARKPCKANQYPSEGSSQEAYESYESGINEDPKSKQNFHHEKARIARMKKTSSLITMPASESLPSKRARLPTDRYSPPELPSYNAKVRQSSQPNIDSSGYFESSKQAVSIIRQLNGDEAKAWVMYKRGRLARKYLSTPSKSLPTRKRCKTNQCSPERLSKEATGFHASASTKVKSQPSQLSDQDESEYKSLWIYYMTPVTRSHEELRSGMILRNKHAKCSLLRSKGSTFRQALHKRILDLEKKGDKYEILNMLSEMKRFDMSVQAGEGPPHLVANILGPQNGGDEIEVLDAAAISDMQGRDENIENEGDMVDLSSSCDAPSIVDLSENLKVTAPTTTIVFPEQEQCPGTSVPSKNNSPLPNAQQNLLGASTARCHDAFEKCTASRGVDQPDNEVIDLCLDDDDLSPRSKLPTQTYGEVIDLLDDDEIDEVIVID